MPEVLCGGMQMNMKLSSLRIFLKSQFVADRIVRYFCL